MQFHENGFHPGDPEVKKVAKGYEGTQGVIPNELDVLVIGSGPAGLTLAAQLSQFPEIKTRVIERKDGPMFLGQADGINCRSMEMFEAFGFADKVLKEAYWVNETHFWKPDENDSNKITRDAKVQDVKDGISSMPHTVLNQGRVHDLYMEVMKNSPTKLEVDYSHALISVDFNDSDKEYPVIVKVDCNGEEKTIKTKYLVGCDGARSIVRAAIGGELKGDRQGQAWGVMDVLVKTDFPDLRYKNIIKSDKGNILLIPREGGQLTRIYVELDKLDNIGDSKSITLERLKDEAKNIFAPYSFEVQETAWWSVYEVGHSVTDKFDDVAVDEINSKNPHVFIAGDACHTHSAKAGQGMNVSMGDTFNLGWKLISVLKGKCDASLLHTYSQERQLAAQGLIDYDHKWARAMSAPIKDKAVNIKEHFIGGGRFTAGLTVKYQESILTAKPTYQSLANGFIIGDRLHSAPVLRLADAKKIEILESIKIDTKYRVYIFNDRTNPNSQDSSIYKLCEYLEKDGNSPIVKHTKSGDDIDSVISVYGIFQQNHQELEFEQIHSLLKPSVGLYGLKDYEKAFCPDYKNGENIYNLREIDKDEGCIVIIRPDQHIANILPLDAYEQLEECFSNIFIKQN